MVGSLLSEEDELFREAEDAASAGSGSLQYGVDSRDV